MRKYSDQRVLELLADDVKSRSLSKMAWTGARQLARKLLRDRYAANYDCYLGTGNLNVPIVFLPKPMQVGYWGHSETEIMSRRTRDLKKHLASYGVKSTLELFEKD